MSWTRTLVTTLAWVAGSTAAFAQAGGGPQPEKLGIKACVDAVSQDAKRICDVLGEMKTDLTKINAVPESPAFTILNIAPQEVIKPTTPREFGAALLNGVDPNGNFQSGLAVDFAPFMVFAGPGLSLQQYRDDVFARLLANTQISLATTKGETAEDKSLRVSGGLHVTLWNSADPRLDPELTACLFDAARATLVDAKTGRIPPAPLSQKDKQEERLKAREEVLTTKAEECHTKREQLRQRHWSASAWSIGLAGIGTSKDGDVDDTRYGGSGAWMSYSQDLGNFVPGLADFRGQFTVHARWRDNQFVPDPATKGNLIRQDAAIAAAELRLGTSELNFSLESSYLNTSTKGRGHDEFFQFTVAAEYHLFDNIWFNLAVGGTSGREGGRDDGFVLGKFKYGFDSKPAGQPAAQK